MLHQSVISSCLLVIEFYDQVINHLGNLLEGHSGGLLRLTLSMVVTYVTIYVMGKDTSAEVPKDKLLLYSLVQYFLHFNSI